MMHVSARHGKARMARFGPRLGRLTFPIACRNCYDQPCIAACSFGGIAFDAASGDVHISGRCAGCGACAKQCPNDAISMMWRPYTVADFPDPMPLSDATGMTNVSNLLVAGDISGAALIRLAMNEAVRAVDRIEPSGLPQNDPILDVAIIGGGPAGLAAAMRCRERQLSYCVFERDQLASTIRGYPKNKHVMAEPSNIALLSSLWFGDCSKEELLARWQDDRQGANKSESSSRRKSGKSKRAMACSLFTRTGDNSLPSMCSSALASAVRRADWDCQGKAIPGYAIFSTIRMIMPVSRSW